MKRVFHFFLVYSPLASCKKSEKINAPILIKRLTERRTDALSWNRMTLQQSREYNKMKVYNACDSTSLRTKLEKTTKSYRNKSHKDKNCFETASGITSLYYDTKLQALWTYFYTFIIRLLTLDAKYWRVDMLLSLKKLDGKPLDFVIKDPICTEKIWPPAFHFALLQHASAIFDTSHNKDIIKRDIAELKFYCTNFALWKWKLTIYRSVFRKAVIYFRKNVPSQCSTRF